MASVQSKPICIMGIMLDDGKQLGRNTSPKALKKNKYIHLVI